MLFTEYKLNGLRVLENLISRSEFRTIHQAVASLSLFTHPDTCKQVENRNIFQIIRASSSRDRGQYTSLNGQILMLDDNLGPTEAFLWANNLKRNYEHLQFNHVYSDPKNPLLYTNLCNLVVTPAFLAKLTDSTVSKLLKFRSFELYGFVPEGHLPPEKPVDYEKLQWADPLPYQSDLEELLIRRMATKKKSRIVKSARELGWYFTDCKPDTRL